MADTDVVAWLYPGVGTEGFEAASFAINMGGNSGRYVAPRRERRALASPQPQSTYSREERETTEDLEEYDSLEYTACLEIPLSKIPKGTRGLEAGWSPKADLPLPKAPGVSYRHFSLTFNDDYFFIVKDLKSRKGTSVIYGNEDGGPRSDFEWIIGGHEILRDERPIIIKVTQQLQFRIIVKPFDRDTRAFRAKVDEFRVGSGELDEIFESVGIRAPTQLPTMTQSPTDEDFFLKKIIGKGSFAVVNHVWNVRTGEGYALKEPVEKLQKRSIKAWKNEATLMGRISHDHIVKLLGFDEGPSPSLRFEYLRGGSLRDHLKAQKYFSGPECVLITRQTTSALAYLHELEPPIVHRDLSDNNILIDRRDPDGIVVKLGDLGVSKEGPRLNTIVGTPCYFPPEFFGDRTSNGRKTVHKYTKAVDIWALGTVLARLACGLPTFTNEHGLDGTLWCEDIRRQLANHFNRTGSALDLFLLESMLRMKPEERRDARDCHNKSQLLEAVVSIEETEDGEEKETEEDDSEAETVRLEDGFVDLVTQGGTAADSSGTEIPHVFERSDARVSYRGVTELQKVLSDILDPTNSLLTKSDLGAISQFSTDVESDDGAATPRPRPVEDRVQLNEIKNDGNAIAALGSAVPRKRTRELEPYEAALFQLKNFQNESATN